MLKPSLHILNQGQWQSAPLTPHNIELTLVGAELLGSFTGKFKSVLARSIFKIQQLKEAELTRGISEEKIFISGKCFFLTHDRWNDYRQLFIKRKQLAYRLNKLHPHFDYLWLQDPIQKTSVLIDLTTHKSFEVILRGAEQ